MELFAYWVLIYIKQELQPSYSILSNSKFVY